MAGFECYYIVDFGCTLILIHLPSPLPIHLAQCAGKKRNSIIYDLHMMTEKPTESAPFYIQWNRNRIEKFPVYRHTRAVVEHGGVRPTDIFNLIGQTVGD